MASKKPTRKPIKLSPKKTVKKTISKKVSKKPVSKIKKPIKKVVKKPVRTVKIHRGKLINKKLDKRDKPDIKRAGRILQKIKDKFKIKETPKKVDKNKRKKLTASQNKKRNIRINPFTKDIAELKIAKKNIKK